MRTDDRQVKTALVRLNRIWPQSTQFADLLAEAGGEAEPLAEALLQAYSAGLLEVNIRPSQFKVQAGERPVASPLARLQAKEGSMVTTLRHTTEELADDVDRCLVLLLDGACDRSALAAALRAFVRSRSMPGVEPVTAESLDARLARLAKQALLVA
jgi:xanthine/CO dehydrogenase XdhC/CoxF family maturation factor